MSFFSSSFFHVPNRFHKFLHLNPHPNLLHFSSFSVSAAAAMIRTLSPCPSADKTAEIMSRYRPIAPKPQPPSTFPSNPCPHFPTRTRKRSRPAPISPHSLKRSRAATPSHFSFSPASVNRAGAGAGNLVTLPLLPCAPPTSVSEAEINFITGVGSEIPREMDLLQQLQAPVSTCNVITPHPVRPIGSIIRVGCINEAQPAIHLITAAKNPDEVEKEVESEVLPAVISDSNNRVRMANSAYKEMVGQPECPWLDSMVPGDERLKGRRIGGEVTLQLSDAAAVPHSSNGFCCWARIDWRNSDGKKNSIAAFCDVIKLSCASRDYIFTWRFHTQTRDNKFNDASNSICINV